MIIEDLLTVQKQIEKEFKKKRKNMSTISTKAKKKVRVLKPKIKKVKEDNRDKYQKAIDYLNENPDQIKEAWSKPYTHQAGCLFTFVGIYGDQRDGYSAPRYGCITQIRAIGCTAFTPELTEKIRYNSKLPPNIHNCTLKHLPEIRRVQLMIDEERKKYWEKQNERK